MKRCQSPSVGNNGRLQKSPRRSPVSQWSLISTLHTRSVSQGVRLRKRSEQLALYFERATNPVMKTSVRVGGQVVPPQPTPSAPRVTPDPEPTSTDLHPLDFMGRPNIYRSPGLFGRDSKFANPNFKPNLGSVHDLYRLHLTWPKYAGRTLGQSGPPTPAESLDEEMEEDPLDGMMHEASHQWGVLPEQNQRHQYNDVVMTDPSRRGDKQRVPDTCCVVLDIQDVSMASMGLSTPPETEEARPRCTTGFVRDGWLAKRHHQKRLTSRLQCMEKRWHPHRRQSSPKETDLELLSPTILAEIFELGQEPERDQAVGCQQPATVEEAKPPVDALRQSRPRKKVRFNLVPEILGPRHVSSRGVDLTHGPHINVEQDAVPEDLEEDITYRDVKIPSQETTSTRARIEQQRHQDLNEALRQKAQVQSSEAGTSEAAQREMRPDDRIMPNKEGVTESRSRVVTRLGAVVSRYVPASLRRLWV